MIGDPLSFIPDPEELLSGAFINAPETPIPFLQRPQPTFLDRLALAFQQMPMQQPQNDLQGFIQGLAGGFGQARGGAFQQQEADVKLQNQQLAESARLMSQQRWQKYRAQAEQLKAQREAAERQIEAERQRKLDDSLIASRKPKTPEEIKAEAKARTEGEIAGGGGPRNGMAALDPVSRQNVVSSYRQRWLNGEIEFAQIPRDGGIRNDVIAGTPETEAALPFKVRNTLNVLNAARSALGELKQRSRSIHTARGPAAIAAGVGKKVGSALQTDPKARAYEGAIKTLLSTLARGTGEKGTLAEGDVQRQAAGLPGLFASREVADEQFSVFENFLNEQQAAALRTFTQPQAGLGATVKMRAPNGQMKDVPTSKVEFYKSKGAVVVP